MKKSGMIIAGFGMALLMVAGSGYGQETVKTVEGYRIDPAQTAKTAKAPKGARLTNVAGFTTSPAAEAVTVEGFALPEKDLVSIQRNASLAFHGESKGSEVKIKMNDDYNYLKIVIHSTFSSGQIAVELVDPNGEKRGTYNLKTDDLIVTGDKTSKVETVDGNLQREFINPVKGEWIIKAIPVSAEGMINATIIQEYRPAIGTMAPLEVIGTPLPEKKR